MERLDGKTVSEADKIILAELDAMGVTPVKLPEMKGKVPATYIGKYKNYIFVRGWYFWSIYGTVPFFVAMEMEPETGLRIEGNWEAWKVTDFKKIYSEAPSISFYEADTLEAIATFKATISRYSLEG